MYSNFLICIHTWDIILQLELSFKVVDEKEKALKGVTIKIKNDKDSEELTTDDNGEVKAKKKYKAGTKFSLELSKDGYELVTDVTEGITVDARQSENVFSFKMNIKSVSSTSLMTNILNTHYHLMSS